MATLCKNCNHALVFEPALGKLYCAYCGSQFAAEDVESDSKKYRENERVLTRDEVFGDDETYEEFLESYVYTCSECGGEISIHGTEVSTTCIYCGNPNVVFSRVAKEMTPDYIIPFSVTREQALRYVQQMISKSVLLPKELKALNVNDIKGIYLPYWVVNANHEEAAVVQVRGGSAVSKYTYHGRKGYMTIKNFPLDGCKMLSDESSACLEPFDLSAMRKFDEDYLLGFYSNSSDITYEEMYLATERRAKEIYESTIKKEFGKNAERICAESHQTAILNDYKYAMFPVWFITYRCEGKPNTILINGQTGKIVGAVPWNKKAFKWITIISGIVLGVVLTLLLRGIVSALGAPETGKDSASSITGQFILGFGSLFGMLFATVASIKMAKVKKLLQLTQSDKMFHFVKKRQG